LAYLECNQTANHGHCCHDRRNNFASSLLDHYGIYRTDFIFDRTDIGGGSDEIRVTVRIVIILDFLGADRFGFQMSRAGSAIHSSIRESSSESTEGGFFSAFA
jgi:hypothetical protein